MFFIPFFFATIEDQDQFFSSFLRLVLTQPAKLKEQVAHTAAKGWIFTRR